MAVITRALFLSNWLLEGVAFKELIICSISVVSLLETLDLMLTLFPLKLLLPLSFLFCLEKEVHLLRIDDVLLDYVVGGVIIVN